MKVSDYAETLRLLGHTPSEDDFYAAGFSKEDLDEAEWFTPNPKPDFTSEASVNSYDPSLRDNLRVGLEGKLKSYGLDENLSAQLAYNLAGSRNPTDGTNGGGLLDFTPVGLATGIQEGYRDAKEGLSQGDYTKAGVGAAEAGLNVLGALPATKAVASGIGKVGKYLADQHDPTVTRTFFGPTSPKADLTALKEAEQLTEQGVDAKRIWQETGWWDGPNGWRFEVDDSQMNLPTNAQGPNSEVFNHPQFWEALDNPQMEMGPGIVGETPPTPGALGEFNPNTQGVSVYGSSPEQNRQIAVHELQHVIQSSSNDLGKGANPAYVKKFVDRNLQNLGPAGYRAATTIANVGARKRLMERLLEEEGDKALSNPSSLYNDLLKENNFDLKYLQEDLQEVPFVEELITDLEQFGYSMASNKSFDDIFSRGGFSPRASHEMYEREAGEVEARIAGSRASMDPITRRHTLPSENMDVDSYYTFQDLDRWFKGLEDKRFNYESSRPDQR